MNECRSMFILMFVWFIFDHKLLIGNDLLTGEAKSTKNVNFYGIVGLF